MTVSKVYVSDLGELAKAFGKLADRKTWSSASS